jgi:hypothetical protein
MKEAAQKPQRHRFNGIHAPANRLRAGACCAH